VIETVKLVSHYNFVSFFSRNFFVADVIGALPVILCIAGVVERTVLVRGPEPHRQQAGGEGPLCHVHGTHRQYETQDVVSRRQHDRSGALRWMVKIVLPAS
jgi:hypothetical protein